MKRSRIKPKSNKRIAQDVKEKALKQKLWLSQDGKCAKCQCDLRWCFPPPSKHEIIRRSQGGDPTDEKNCEYLCGVCHLKADGIRVIEHLKVLHNPGDNT